MIFTFRLRIAILFCTLLIACREKMDIPALPAGITTDSLISPDNMILILADVHVIEAALLLERNTGIDSKDKPEYYYRGIFEKYHISPARYEQNLTFYRQNPENYSKMYEQVIVILQNRKKYIPGKK